MIPTVPLVSPHVDHEESVGTGKLVAIGVAAGLLGGFLGVGGGIIIVPLLVWAGMGRHRSHATSLASFIIIATVGAISYGVSDAIDVGVAVSIGVGGIVGSIVGASLMHRMSTRNLTILFGLVLLVAAIRMITGAEPVTGASSFASFDKFAVAAGIGLVSGSFAGLAGIGGGVVIVPASVLLLGLDQHVAQGTSLAAIVFAAISGSVVNVRNRRVDLKDSMIIGLGGVGGSLLGTRLALEVEGATLSIVFGILVLFVSARTLYRVVRAGRPQPSEVVSES
jgi:uncharacterized protein